MHSPDRRKVHNYRLSDVSNVAINAKDSDKNMQKNMQMYGDAYREILHPDHARITTTETLSPLGECDSGTFLSNIVLGASKGDVYI
jgi:hypothetical protein